MAKIKPMAEYIGRKFLSMKQITVNTSQGYDIFINHGILFKCGETLSSILNTRTLAIITDDIVNSLYAETVINSLTSQGFKVCKFVFQMVKIQKHICFK